MKGWFKLNSDGVSLGNPEKAGGSGLICESHGNWVKGYTRNIGVATSIIAEFWALRDGLLLASQLGITQLVVELDAKVLDLVISKNNLQLGERVYEEYWSGNQPHC
nr:putative ribonuclease h protein [Quercus suber]